jgi:AP2 domain.
LKTLTTNNGYVVKLDDQDFDRFSRYRFTYENGRVFRWIYQNNGQRPIRLHREILDAPAHLEVHHDNEDPLDNQRHNLILLTKADHSFLHSIRQPRRGGKYAGSCPYKGVTAYHGKWRVIFKHEARRLFLGDHPTPEDAALVYDAAVLHYRGGQGYLNLL